MADTEKTTAEKARSCPKCGNYGELQGSSPVARGAKVETYHCMNQVCPWFNTGWLVQIDADGTIAERNNPGPKQFPAIPKQQMDFAEEYLERLKRVEQVGGREGE